MVNHPLEPLSAGEVARAVELLAVARKLTATTRIVMIALKEPAKTAVHSGNSWASLPREAAAVLFDNASNSCFEAELNLTTGVVSGFVHIPDVQPTMTIDEQVECERAVLESPEFAAALKRHHGISDTRLVMVDIWSAGYYGDQSEQGKRLARPLCFLRSDQTDNGYARPIEEIRPVVDLNTMSVLRVEEFGAWPIPPGSSNYAAARMTHFRTDIKPLAIVQPDGPGFTLQGNTIAWQKWSLVIGFNAREGLTLHHVRYRDSGRDRSILYRASLTEMVVPYGDPTPTQVRKNAFDVGEYGMGMCANSLRLGCDCVGHIEYLDAHICDSRGRPLTIENAICIHEEDYGILWKHTDRRLPDAPEVRRSRRLVISSISTVENYEYGFFWYFYQDGNIQFEIKLTGVLSLGAVRPGKTPPFGTLVAPQVYAPNHQHFFNVRLDFDIDGTDNTVQQIDVVADPIDADNPYENAFRARAIALETEQVARSNLNLETARTWKIINPHVRNALGEPVGYKFLPGDNCVPFASPRAWWRKRAGFVNHHVWVTPFSAAEKFAAGDYPNQSTGGDGLVRWTAADRSITDTDIVFWYTFGHTHIPRPEDYPVMPTAYIGFTLKPNGFFDLNPAIDIPPSEPLRKDGPGCCH
jgi:primary-amine oxidase